MPSWPVKSGQDGTFLYCVYLAIDDIQQGEKTQLCSKRSFCVWPAVLGSESQVQEVKLLHTEEMKPELNYYLE